MKVRELMEELSSHNPETTVYLASDEEGNRFYHVGSFGKDGYGLYLYPTHERKSDYTPVRDANGLLMPPKVCPTHGCLLNSDLSGDWCPEGNELGINCLPEDEVEADPLDFVDDGDDK